jgi:glycosyltransferase involved in cell wall biosynthesis
VTLVGPVEELDFWFHRARVFVAPLRYGAGIKGKSLDALRYGQPLVTTSVGAEGLGLEHGITAMIADDEVEFTRLSAAVHSDGNLWQTLRRQGLLLAAELTDRQRFMVRVQDFLHVLETSRRGEPEGPVGEPNHL